METATREAKEKIGLDPSLVEVVTCLEPFLSKGLLRVIPVSSILSNKNDYNPSPDAAEVEAIFDAPLEMFLKDENKKWEKKEWMGIEYLLHFFDYEMNGKKYLIWGLTAAILIRASIEYLLCIRSHLLFFYNKAPNYKVPRVVLKDTTMT